MSDMLSVLRGIDAIADDDGWASSGELASYLDCPINAAATAAAHAKEHGWTEARYPTPGLTLWGMTDAGFAHLEAASAHD